MLWGRIAQLRSEARYPNLFGGLVASLCPHLQPRAGVTCYDVSGWHRHGTLQNMDPATDWVLSGRYNALDFDNADDQVTGAAIIPYPAMMTVSVWYLLRTAPGGSAFATLIVSNQNSGLPSPGFDIRGRNTTQLEVAIGIGGSDVLQAFGTIALNVWTHIAFTYDGSNLRTFQDGAEVNSSSRTGTLLASTQPLCMSRNPVNAGRRMNGQIADLAVWGRAFTGSEILQLFHLGPGGYLAPKRGRVNYGSVTAGINRRRRILCGASI